MVIKYAQLLLIEIIIRLLKPLNAEVEPSRGVVYTTIIGLRRLDSPKVVID